MEANPRTLSNYQAVALMRLWRRPIIGWGLGYLDWSIPDWVLTGRKFILRRFYSLFDALVAYSSKGAEDYVRLGIASDKVFVAPNAVSSEQAEEFYQELLRSPDCIAEWKHKLGLSDKPIVLYVGRLLPHKHVDDLIMTCAPLTDSCELLIVGDGPERSRLEALAQREFPNTRFLGHRTGRELAECFFGADLFVLPGTGGLAVQEAMIYGKPVIVATGDGTQSDLVREGVNGFLVSSGDVPGLRCAIQTCLQDPERLRRMGSESRRIVHQEVNMEAMVRGFITALNSVGPHSRERTA
jgi:glycosyltransferase involved in cell wall biosynthesis